MMPKPLLPAVGLAVLWVATAPPLREPPTRPLVGVTVPSRVAIVSPEQAGKIVAVPVEEGDRVEADQVLFLLNSTLEQLEVDRLKALAESDLFERRAKSMLAHAKLQAERVRDLRSQDIGSGRDLQAGLHELELARLKVEQAHLDMAQARNSLAQAQERLAQRTVKSPFAGIVTQCMQGVGEAVEKFVPVIEVMSLDPLCVEFECPLKEQHLFVKGGQALISPAWSPSDVRTGTILFVSMKATASSHSFMIRASVANSDLAWKTGQKMTIEPSPSQAAPTGGK